MHRILIVDDELMVRRGVALGVDWQQMGCIVAAEATNGAEGLRLALELKPDLIITDIRMPKMDGLAMLAELRKQGCNSKAIVLTAYDEFSFAQKALRLGAVDYLLKPFRDQDLAGAVTRILEQTTTPCVPSPQSLLPDIPKAPSKYVAETVQYIVCHYSDHEIGIADIAGNLCVSESHLSHVFKKETNCTVTSYLTCYRIHVAMMKLRDHRPKIYEVAEMVGYRDVNYFGSIFKKLTGLSPSEYQERCT
ncbi:MAG TPA: response regulator [Candidatus Limiplasma sp.]|nr:response regulator [Candidatus Limiplasma sp.]